MEPKFQTSFIPKKPIVVGAKGPSNNSHSISILSVAVTIIFILTLAAMGGLFAYKRVLDDQIIKAKDDIEAARDSFELETIKELINASGRIKAAEILLGLHVAPSQIFDVLQSLTVKKVKLGQFSYVNKDNSFVISMDVESQSYNALSQQARIFSESDFIKNPMFVDFNINQDGTVSSKFKAQIDPSSLSYKKAIESLGQVTTTSSNENI